MAYTGKTSYKYSDELNNWTSATKAGDKRMADHWHQKWVRKFAGLNAPGA